MERVQAADLRKQALHQDTSSTKPKPKGKGKGKDKKGKGKGKDKGHSKSGTPPKDSPDAKSKGKAKGEKVQGKTACYDRKKVCLEYLQKKCNKGAGCPKHHNPPCPALCKGETCGFGDKCLFPHWNVPKPTALTAAQGKAGPKAKAKAQPKTAGTDH